MSACDDYQPFKYYVNGDVDYYDSHPGDPVKTMYGVDIGGVCVYPKANCSADTIGNECCDLKGERNHGYSIATNLYNYGGIVLAVVIGRILNALRSQWIAAQRDKAARVVQDKAKREAKREASGEHSESPTEEEADGEPGIAGPRYFAELTFREKAQMLFDAGGYLAYLVSGIIVSTKMTQEIAIELTSTQRVALQTGGTAFLVPFAILFSFLDDLVHLGQESEEAQGDVLEISWRPSVRPACLVRWPSPQSRLQILRRQRQEGERHPPRFQMPAVLLHNRRNIDLGAARLAVDL